MFEYYDSAHYISLIYLKCAFFELAISIFSGNLLFFIVPNFPVGICRTQWGTVFAQGGLNSMFSLLAFFEIFTYIVRLLKSCARGGARIKKVQILDSNGYFLQE